ncbi:uncharacterized protein LOC143512024 isoform X1 [Brachyhypopomus gauderio]|uniref:uncharacterized protein LOC143512024 isoform X1 n=1 Tax=Brachyhypopomus gauderio TaxID=698409 RepID=UPI004042ED77
MRQGSEMLKFYVIVIGQIFNCHLNFVERLKKRLQIHEVNSEEESDFILAFVSIVSRVGTDIEFALPRFPTAQPVLLVVLHHTFEEQYMAPDSQIHVRHMSNVFAVDCLFHEDKGLLPCLRNEQALKAITDHLINTGASSNLDCGRNNGCQSGPRWTCTKFSCIMVLQVPMQWVSGVGRPEQS